jgi:pimeloyl-ACP methyl ester carboxylesterase
MRVFLAVPGKRPRRSRKWAPIAIAFIRALGLTEVDVLGFSIGGMVAQEITLQAPDLVRRLILVGTGPRGADMAKSKSAQIFSASYDPPEHMWLDIHFTPSAPSRAAGLEFLKRKHLRKENRDPEMSGQGIAAQGEAIGKYVAYGESDREYLKSIRQPTLIVQGSNDVTIPTVNSCTMQQLMPNAELIIYPDANHGSFYQYPELFVEQANQFLTWTIQKASSVPAADRLLFPGLAPEKGDDE